ncbi:sodium:solute symporter family protein [Cardinium endosymbiont of Tipula unca]|uniref:sodium:solute symporter family protein n=1 Tax=Cardinium endosymbiont of Tipula unca TaxID=3066216 RepID=UPI0030D34FD1
MGIDLVIIVAFLTISLLLGLSHGRKVETFRDYALGRDLSVFVLTCSLVATMSHAQTLNTIALDYDDGFPGFFSSVILLFMVYVGAKVFIVRMAEFFGDFSIAESMGKLYGPIARRLTALVILVLLLCSLVTQLKVTLEVVRFSLPDLPNHTGYLLAISTGLIMILYAALGGAKSIVMTDILQFLCFGCAFPVIGYLLLRHAKIPFAEGWAHFKQLPQFTDIDHIFSLQVLKRKAMFAVTLLFALFTPLAIQRVYMAKSLQQGQKVIVASVAARAYIFGALFCLAVLLHLGGHVLNGEGIISYIISLVQSPAVRGILGITVLALLMSSVDSALHLLSVVIVNDLLPPSLFVGKSGDTKKVQMGRWCILSIGIIGLYSALVYEGDIYILMNKGSSIYVPMVSVPFAMALLGFRVRKAVALVAMVVTGVYGTYVSYHNAYARYTDAPILAGLATSVVVSICTLVVCHYIFPQLPHTGWVGIKDRTAVMLQNQETKHWWMQQLHNFKVLFTKQYRKGLLPTKESSFVILGAYFICSTLLALCFIQKDYFFPYIYWYMAVMVIGTILVIYPSFDMYKRKPDFIYLVWPVVLFMLFFVSGIQFAKLGHFSPMVCALLICHLAASMLFFSLKVSIGMLVAALMLHASMLFGTPLGNICSGLLAQGLSWELVATALLAGAAAATGFGIYRYFQDSANAKDKVIELDRTYERRASLEAIYNQVNWHRLDPTHGSEMLQEMGKMLEKPCQYLYTYKQEKLGEDVNIFMKKLREFSSLLLQRAKEERSLKLNKRAVKSVAIAPIIFKAHSSMRSLDEPMQLLLCNQTKAKSLEVDPDLFERLLSINFLAISKSEQALDAIVYLTIVDTTLRYDYAKATQLEKSAHVLSALAFCMSTHSKPEIVLPVYDMMNEATPVYLPKAAAQLYQAESRQIVQAHGGYIAATETKDKLTCLYVLPVAGKNVMHFKTYDPTDLGSEIAETPESLAQEKELVTLLTTATTLTKEVVEKTITFIKNAHGLVKRKSGEPYYTHPMAVAKILLEATKDPETILAGLLHDVVEDTPVTLNQIQVMYGPQVAYIVDMVTHYNTNGYRWKLDEDQNRSMLYQCKDIRVVYVKLADRLHNTQTLCFRKPVDQKRIAKETMAFYLPWGKRNNISFWLSDMKHICEEILNKQVAAVI